MSHGSNINAINDLAREIINTQSHITVSALSGNAGAGGVFLARCGPGLGPFRRHSESAL